MTISSQVRTAGPFACNGSTTVFPFAFKVFTASDVSVVFRDTASGAEVPLVLNIDYTVSLNANQNANPGGAISTIGPAFATGTTLTLTSKLQYLQPTDLTNQGAFYPKVISDALDRLTIFVQQVLGIANRALKFPISDGNLDGTLPGKDQRKGRVLVFHETTGLPIAGPTIGDVIPNDYIGEDLPVNPFNGMRWYKPSEATTFVYYVDGDSGQWVQEPVVSADSTLELQLAAADSTVLIAGVEAGLTPMPINSIKSLSTAPKIEGRQYLVKGFYADTSVGGGIFKWNAAKSKTTHNGGTVIDPDRVAAWNGTQANLSVLYTAAVSGVGVFDRVSVDTLNAYAFGAVADSSTDNTITINKAISTFLPDSGGILNIPSGARFNLKSLTLPKRSTLVYYEQDDISTTAGTKKATSELVTFQANANNNGIVNEAKEVASFHPGHVVEVRKDVTSHTAFIGPGQSQTNPVRASYNFLDEGKDIYRTLYEKYNDFSLFSGVRNHIWLNRITLNGVGTSNFTVAPVKGNLIIGITSGASGHVISTAAGSLELEWFSGVFQSGETVVCNRGTIASPINEASSSTVSSVVETLKTGAPLSAGYDTGYWCVGLPPSAAKEMFTVGGKVGVQRTRNGGWYLPTTVTDPSIVWADNFEAVTINGFELTYDTTPAAASRRMHLRKYGQTANIGHIGAVRGHTNFTDAVVAATSSYNIASIVKNGTGDYTITFAVAFTRADYTVAITKSNPSDDPYVFAQTATELRIRNATNGTSTLANLLGRIHVSCVGGDI